jgi:hypothetical protein
MEWAISFRRLRAGLNSGSAEMWRIGVLEN